MNLSLILGIFITCFMTGFLIGNFSRHNTTSRTVIVALIWVVGWVLLNHGFKT